MVGSAGRRESAAVAICQLVRMAAAHASQSGNEAVAGGVVILRRGTAAGWAGAPRDRAPPTKTAPGGG